MARNRAERPQVVILTKTAANRYHECCIAGGARRNDVGFLLARAGVDVVVLEKHGDFLRHFRGETIDPSTLEPTRELGLLDEFLKQPHHKVSRRSGQIGDAMVTRRRSHPAADNLQGHRLHAVMGLPQLPRRPWPA